MISQLKKDITGFFRKFFGLNNVDSLLTQVKNDSNVPIDESNENDEKDKVIANYKEELRKLQEDFQKDIKKEIKSSHKHVLLICFEDGSSFSLENSSYTSKNIVRPWIDFHQWFFEKDTPYFVLCYRTNKDNETRMMIRRENIKTFTIKLEETKI